MSADAARDLADELSRRGLAAPARLLADAHRPISPLIADLAVAVAPWLGFLGSGGRDLANLFEDPAGLERLVQRLDEPEERDAGTA